MTTILLADDHTMVRQGLRALLEEESGFTVVGEAKDGPETIALTESLRPDVLVVDLMMPGVGGLEVMRQVGRKVPTVRFVVLSMYANEAYVVEALRSGAMGYVLKDTGAEELVRAIRHVAQGGRYLSPPLSEKSLEAYLERVRGGGAEEALTPREREVLQLCAEGRSNAEIAERLFISPRTAETHRANLMRKLGLHSQAELIHYAFQSGLVPVTGRRERDGA
jgi:two-component system, NarL family, response regulator NreC